MNNYSNSINNTLYLLLDGCYYPSMIRKKLNLDIMYLLLFCFVLLKVIDYLSKETIYTLLSPITKHLSKIKDLSLMMKKIKLVTYKYTDMYRKEKGMNFFRLSFYTSLSSILQMGNILKGFSHYEEYLFCCVFIE